MGGIRNTARTGRAIAYTLSFLLFWITPAHAVDFLVVYRDDPGEGFFDPDLGPARRAAFEYAATLWSYWLSGPVPVEIRAGMDPLGGSSTSAILGSAGAMQIWRNFANAPLSNMWYSAAQANQHAGYDLKPDYEDISVTLNSDVDNEEVLGLRNWYYGTDQQPDIHFDFVAVVLHEIAHGLGFFSLISYSSGDFFLNQPDIYSAHLYQSGVGHVLDMTDVERFAACRSDSLYWIGAAVQETHGGLAKMYAPTTYASGSSVSHWDTTHYPHELLEPYYMGPNHSPGLTLDAFEDMGWNIPGAPDVPLLPPNFVHIRFQEPPLVDVRIRRNGTLAVERGFVPSNTILNIQATKDRRPRRKKE